MDSRQIGFMALEQQQKLRSWGRDCIIGVLQLREIGENFDRIPKERVDQINQEARHLATDFWNRSVDECGNPPEEVGRFMAVFTRRVLTWVKDNYAD